MQRDIETVKDMISACAAIQNFVVGISETAFHTDEKTQSAVIYQLMIIGEAAKRLSDEFCWKHAEIPWRDWGAFRNILIHQYHAVEIEQVWYTVSHEIPELKSALNSIYSGQ